MQCHSPRRAAARVRGRSTLPGVFDGGQQVKGPVSHVALFPTVLDVLGLPAHPRHNGKSFLPLLKKDPKAKPEPVFCQGRWMVALIQDGIKVIWHDLKQERLVLNNKKIFDRRKGPWEIYDIWKDYKDIVKSVLKILKKNNLKTSTLKKYSNNVPSDQPNKNFLGPF